MKTEDEISRPRGAEETNAPKSKRLQAAFDLCLRKTRHNVTRLADEPKSYAWAVDGNYFGFREGFHEIGNWTSSFFTGMALLAWRQTGDDHFLSQVLRLAPWYRDKVFTHHRETMHDLGFLYSLYSVALHKLTGDASHRDLALRAAKVLAARYIPTGGFIRAWGPIGDPDPLTADMAIIDCMMNLPLLYWASAQTGDPSYHDIAVRHADTTLRTFVRADDSVYHAFRFDTATGKPARGDTFGGCAVESHWARGTAWAIYGFALSYTWTNDVRYLNVALRLARKFVALLDDEVVPLWDFRLPVGAKPLRDASAASVAVCGMQEILKHRPDELHLASAAYRLLSRLCDEDHIDFDERCPGVQKFGQVGNGNGGAQNAYTSWGDYFLMEALTRELYRVESWWCVETIATSPRSGSAIDSRSAATRS